MKAIDNILTRNSPIKLIKPFPDKKQMEIKGFLNICVQSAKFIRLLNNFNIAKQDPDWVMSYFNISQSDYDSEPDEKLRLDKKSAI